MAETKTLFQRIFDGEIPARMIHEDDQCGAFFDINPQAPVHILIVPRLPLPGISALTEAQKELIGHLFHVANSVARDQGLRRGYRLVINEGQQGGQSVPHLHLHLLGGRDMAWPPG